jgi:hypothetical protein
MKQCGESLPVPRIEARRERRDELPGVDHDATLTWRTLTCRSASVAEDAVGPPVDALPEAAGA